MIAPHLLAACWVHMSVRKKEWEGWHFFHWVCARKRRPVVDNVSVSTHSGRTEQNNPTLKSSNTTPGISGWLAQQDTFPSKFYLRLSNIWRYKNSSFNSTHKPSKNPPKKLLVRSLHQHPDRFPQRDTQWHTQNIKRARKYNTQWSHFTHDPHQLSVSLETHRDQQSGLCVCVCMRVWADR